MQLLTKQLLSQGDHMAALEGLSQPITLLIIGVDPQDQVSAAIF